MGADLLIFGIRSVGGDQGYIMFVESKKSICLICLALLTAIMGIAYVIFQTTLMFGVTIVSFIAMSLLFSSPIVRSSLSKVRPVSLQFNKID